ncbi:RNA polymerase sigma factor [Nocardia terpenica]|uniref:RNA polymerase sigma factor 70 region 4 type 2 domain-containing protein n=1 Tax=Nocardia terpenica TaxID=455432 RepID=A0A6G9ZCW4_9NOCA|nr:sigma-70 family RNA polymerase sigma factor [Nocardia terpenica]QIS23459.1 hypothetical protein F6W96_39300 [Nocardia terpenica]
MRSIVAGIDNDAADWESTAAELAGYACRILRMWISSGAIVGHVRDITGIRLPWRPELRETDIAEELAGMTIAVALKHFRAIMTEGRWDATRGTCLETYFVGQCLLQFPNEYRRWLRENYAGRPQRTTSINDIEELHDSSACCDLEETAVIRLDARKALDELPGTQLRTIVVLHSLGYTHAEIGRNLGLTAKAVEMILYRMRKSHTRVP